jgi:hypothetical protein
MPADSVIVILGVLAMFALFGAVLAWSDFQTRQSTK